MRNTIERIAARLRNRKNFIPESLAITLVLLFLIFQLSQLWGFSSTAESEQKVVRIELRERTPPVLVAREIELPQPRKAVEPESQAEMPSTPEPANAAVASPQSKQVDVSSLVQSFDTGKLLKSPNTTRRTVNRPAPSAVSQVSIRTSNSASRASEVPLEVSKRPTAVPAGRRNVTSAASSSIDVGDPSSGAATISTIGAGIATGAGSSRTTRATGGGGAVVAIAVPGTGAGEQATLDLHDLIEWMKAHPGAISQLVGYEMGHRYGGDLSSAVRFAMRGREFTMFLSVNEKELLLRICLIENNDFTLLKDNGIRETSHFLTSGDVLRDGSAINSLISTRRAPQNKASEFYDIFWSWWQTERANMGKQL